ncbi:MAG: hypothetical protein ACR2HR_15775 [Euzebya sp.]
MVKEGDFAIYEPKGGGQMNVLVHFVNGQLAQVTDADDTDGPEKMIEVDVSRLTTQ